jgi:hypothetical protein
LQSADQEAATGAVPFLGPQTFGQVFQDPLPRSRTSR